MVMNSNEENALERIQELFPNDDLRLKDKHPATPKCKSLSRKRSLTASRLQRALSGSKIKVSQSDSVIEVGESEWCTTLKKKKKTLSRTFLLDCPVRLTAGVQCQERHLFLFTDLLLVAKARSTGNYKLKEAVRLCDLWLADCVDQVAEVSLPRSTSFVIGWPTTNLVVTFSCKHSRDLWLARLNQLIELPEKQASRTTTIRVSYWDPVCTNKTESTHSVTVSCKATAEDCVQKLLKQLENESVDKDICKSKYQLWVKCEEEGSCATPYPLIGHERPFAIKMSCLRAAGAEDAFDHDHNHLHNHDHQHQAIRLCFTLRRARTASFHLVPPKKNKRVRRAPILQKVFRRTSSKPDNLDSLDTSENSYSEISSLSQPFSSLSLCQDGHLNKTVLDILTELFHKGPYTQGIFRKSANNRARRELCRKLQCEPGCDVSAVNAILLSAAITDILRGQSDCLLTSRLYQKWLDVTTLSSDAHKRQEIARLLDQIPPTNLLFLRHFVCVLWHIAHNSSENMMTATNLARCVGPSLLWPKPSNSIVEPSKQAGQCILVASLVEFLILQCREVLGEDCLGLFGPGSVSGSATSSQQNADGAPVSRETARCDSGHEESDSLHSTPSSQDSGGLRRDDSSIDSLENALMSDTDKLAAATTNASLTNLSRDSGLTMSDTQLYTTDEADEAHHCDESSHAHVPAYPHAAGREVIKRRVSRVRTWDRPSSSYFASPDLETPDEDITMSMSMSIPTNLCKSTSEESILDDRTFHHYAALKSKSMTEQSDMVRSKSMHHFEVSGKLPQAGTEEDWRSGLSGNYAEDDYVSGGSSSWDIYGGSPRRTNNLSNRTRQMYEASVRVYDAEMHHAAPARVESSHSEEEDESHSRALSLAQPPPLPPKPGDVLRSYLNGGGRSQSASVVLIGGKSVITTTAAKSLTSPPPLPPLNCTAEYVEQSTAHNGHHTLKHRKEGTRPSRFVAATMSKATSMMAAVGREIGLKSVGGASKSSHSCSGNSGYCTSTTRRVKCRPSQSLNPQGYQGLGINGSIQGNPPPYRHPPVAPSLSEGPWRTLRSRGVTVHQWQPRRYECRPPAEESYV